MSIDTLRHRLSRLTRIEMAYACAILVSLLFGGWLSARTIDIFAANLGQGPLDYLWLQAQPPADLHGNAPGLVESLKFSLPLYLYVPLSRVGIDPLLLLRFHAFIEPLTMAVAAFFLGGALFPKSELTFRLLLSLMICASGLLSPDLARWSSPEYDGLYYVFADSARMIGLACLLRGNVIMSGLMLALSCLCHPIIGGIGCLFAFAMLLASPVKYANLRSVYAIAAFLLPVMTWFSWSGLFASLSAGTMDPALWLSINRMASFHLFPFLTGVFDERANLYFIPFCSCILLAAMYWRDILPSPDLRRQIACGVLAILLLTALGVLASALAPSPGIIRLGLHRSSDLVLLFCGAVALRGLWLDISAQRLVRSGLAALLLAWPLISNGFPLLPVFLLALDKLVREPRQGFQFALCCAVTAASAALLLGYALKLPLANAAFNTLGYSQILVLVAILVPFVFPHAPWNITGPAKYHALLGLSAVLGLYWYYGQLSRPRVEPGYRAYYAAQIWARENTPTDALFFVDPGKFYGWSAFSHRANLGNVRDWIVWSTTYAFDRPSFEAGVQHLSFLGVDYRKYLGWPRPMDGMDALTAQAQARFYALTTVQLQALRQKFGVTYMVYFNARLRIPPPLGDIVYRNNDVTILKLD